MRPSEERIHGRPHLVDSDSQCDGGMRVFAKDFQAASADSLHRPKWPASAVRAQCLAQATVTYRLLEAIACARSRRAFEPHVRADAHLLLLGPLGIGAAEVHGY